MDIYTCIILQIVLWLSIAGILHSYVFYPYLLKMLAKGKNRYGGSRLAEGVEEWPPIVVLMAVYNEEAVIEETLKSILENDYDQDRFEVVIGSDNSTDRSHEIIESFQGKHPNLSLQVFEGRCGKIRIINQLVSGRKDSAPDTIYILCDANVVWSETLAKQLASHFRDPRVGVVASNVTDQSVRKKGIAHAEDAYVGRENCIKHYEGILWGRVMGAFGACYAMRCDLYEEIPSHFIVDDFYLTMHCFEEGKDAIVDLDAVCYEAVSEEISEEFRRKKRISIGNFQNLDRFGKFLLPWNCGFPTWFAFWSHKGLRWAGPFLLLLAIAASINLAVDLPVYRIVAIGFIFTFIVAGVDKFLDYYFPGFHVRSVRFVRYFYSMNLALLLGAFQYCKGVRNSIMGTHKAHCKHF